MIRSFNGEYAAPDDDTYHTHLDCPEGKSLLQESGTIRGARAKEDRDLCDVCRRMTPPLRMPPTFGGH